MRQSAYPGGMLAAFVIAPASAAALAVLGLIGHLYITDPAAADVPLADYASMAVSVWISALMFAYPAAIALFAPLWLILRGLRLWGGFTALVAGGAAGLVAMLAYLYRIYGGDLETQLTGGVPLGELPLADSLFSLALPLIGVVSGAVGGLIFTSLERAGR
ncbi:hypothetical protein [Glycocaulis sp.]|uniref:hypothetical protein n=1 Tax=Glycocaulis sp. TaxID=1969725 RepID=UPI003F6FAEF5